MTQNLRMLLLGGENESVDFKNTISNSYKIAKTLVAFANNKGGKLLIGVTDEGKIRGVKDEEEEKFMLHKAATQYCKPAIEIEFEEAIVEEKLILTATIPRSDFQPCYCLDENQKWWAYIRVHDQSVIASSVMLEVLRNQHKPTRIKYTEVEKKLFQYLEAHQHISLKEFSLLAHLNFRKSVRILSKLIIAEVLKPIDHGPNERYGLMER